MKSQILLTLALLGSVTGYSQDDRDGFSGHDKGHHRKPRNVEKVQRLDSVIGLVQDQQYGREVEDYVFVYRYDRGMDNPEEVVKLHLPDRGPMNRQLYSYNRDGFKKNYLYQEWIEALWKDRMLVEYFPDEEGRLSRELFSGPGTAEAWVPYQQHFYSYDDRGRIALYLRKMYNTQDGWYDFSENIWTFNDSDQLTGRMEKRVADDYVIWTEVFNYGDGIKPIERIRQTMRYDPVLKYNKLTNDTRQLYYYDEFNDPVVTEQFKWSGGQWVYSGKSLFFYSFIPGRKVDVCHNGHTISVAPQAVKAHLAHGDSLGPCEEPKDKCDDMSDGHSGNPEKSAKIYPNPASGSFELELPDGHRYSVALLISDNGRVVRSMDIGSGQRFTFNAGGLRSGRYILKLRGDSVSAELAVILK